MNLKFGLAFLFIISCKYIDNVASQSADCNYSLNGTTYQCKLTFSDDFINIDGKHLTNKSDNDVQVVFQESKLYKRTFPTKICEKFENLREITFTEIGLENIEENSLENCKNLAILFLTGNKIKKTWSRNVFASQTKLERLDLYGNEMGELPEGIFDPLINLDHINLSRNKLTSVNSKLFEKTTKLRVIYLSFNLIRELPQNIFTNLQNLEVVHLTSNKLTTIDLDSFGVHPKFEVFSFSRNELESFDERVIDLNTGLRYIYASSNPCVDGEADIYADDEARNKIKTHLKKCFDNYGKR